MGIEIDPELPESVFKEIQLKLSGVVSIFPNMFSLYLFVIVIFLFEPLVVEETFFHV